MARPPLGKPSSSAARPAPWPECRRGVGRTGARGPRWPALRPLALLVLLAALPGCPEERPGAARQIPVQRLPPALAVEPPPADGGPPPAPDAGRAHHP